MTASLEFDKSFLPDFDESSINSVGIASALCLKARPLLFVGDSLPWEHESAPLLTRQIIPNKEPDSRGTIWFKDCRLNQLLGTW